MEMTQFQRDFVRMLDSMREECKGETTCVGIGDKECEECPLTTFCGDNDVCFNAEKIIEIVTQWAKEHPFVTSEQKFKEDWGREPKSIGGIYLCPSYFGFEECESPFGQSATNPSCIECEKKFWNAEYKEPKKEG